MDRAAAGRRPPAPVQAHERRPESPSRAAAEPARGDAHRPGAAGGELARMTVHQLVRLYPRAWRDRYGDEFVEIAGDRHLSGQQVIDVVMGRDRRVEFEKSACRRSRIRREHCRRRRADDSTVEDAMRDVRGSLHEDRRPDFSRRPDPWNVLLLGAGMMFDRQNYPVLGDVMKSLAFPVATVASMPFAILKGQPRKAQLISTIVPLVILAAATWIATKILTHDSRARTSTEDSKFPVGGLSRDSRISGPANDSGSVHGGQHGEGAARGERTVGRRCEEWIAKGLQRAIPSSTPWTNLPDSGHRDSGPALRTSD